MVIKNLVIGFLRRYFTILLTFSFIFITRTGYAYLRPHDTEEFFRGDYWKGWLFLLLILLLYILVREKKEKTATHMYWKSSMSWEKIRFKLSKYARSIWKLEFLCAVSFIICQGIIYFWLYIFADSLIPYYQILYFVVVINLPYLFVWGCCELLLQSKYGWLLYQSVHPFRRLFFIPVGIIATIVPNTFLGFILGGTIADKLKIENGLVFMLFIFLAMFLLHSLNLKILAILSKHFENIRMKRCFHGSWYIAPDFLEKEFFESDDSILQRKSGINLVNSEDFRDVDEEEKEGPNPKG